MVVFVVVVVVAAVVVAAVVVAAAAAAAAAASLQNIFLILITDYTQILLYCLISVVILLSCAFIIAQCLIFKYVEPVYKRY